MLSTRALNTYQLMCRRGELLSQLNSSLLPREKMISQPRTFRGLFMLCHFFVSHSPFGAIEWSKLGIEPIANAIRYGPLRQDALQTLRCTVPKGNWHKMFSQHCCDSITQCLQIPKVLNNDKTSQCDNALQHYESVVPALCSACEYQIPNSSQSCYDEVM